MAIHASMIFMMELFLTVLIGFVLLEAMRPGTISMQKVQQKFFMGIKTPWMLENRAVCFKEQRLGGKGLFFEGCLLVVCGFFVSEAWMIGLMIAVVIFGCRMPMDMSYIWYREEKKKAER